MRNYYTPEGEVVEPIHDVELEAELFAQNRQDLADYAEPERIYVGSGDEETWDDEDDDYREPTGDHEV